MIKSKLIILLVISTVKFIYANLEENDAYPELVNDINTEEDNKIDKELRNLGLVDDSNPMDSDYLAEHSKNVLKENEKDLKQTNE
ncbi:hypothetical protein NEPAR06_0461 [Nematocida parisii]|uniref:Uncharacterized protein n=1 Tax=Nematocida parisii (strain ERTm3) TaxID=935791 RepID=I3EJH7_NEMP3|nr:uncharacterized protein NEPG_01095 [Nematocida parisii ERTm1]EIJ89374.1 hypothetical protein NEQG_00144 [Nematocida parisii ERTm3]KAI5127405.1 hypothetical protein NEPAR08_0846 [Nematocida parisii]EIJ94427.1 hypothetical protein NEPG_01095 [Nematocida parisii ERTm1]KAI5129020.1 hypothetical protein NEPAR03_1466 [Nematocida parisii]KAI5141288.1 hypothetical protein NEPAR04_0850 [Nematocida parisii]|eukprot:XP_013058923.1 hypothetical protein NEPG_01095 [Nematocida parisii ERTm1]